MNTTHYRDLRLLPLLLLGLLSSPLRAEDQPTTETGVGKEIGTVITAEQNPYLTRSSFSQRSKELAALYQLADNQLLWLGHDDAEKKINSALNLLSSAALQGLDPKNYDVDVLRQKLPTALQLDDSANLQLALYDTALSVSMLRFVHDLHYGTVDPKSLNFNVRQSTRKKIDLPALIKNDISSDKIAQLPEQVEPKLKQYAKLKQALVLYSELAKNTPPIKLLIKKSLRIGNSHPQLAELKNFLIALGDLPKENTAPTNADANLRYTSQLAEAVKKFQRRHGLPATGILDKETANAINVPIEQRVVQIKLAMERLRWLPELPSGQAVVVNIPAFQLWAFDDITADNPNILNINVVVGKSPKNQTPALMADMRFINFAPYWNVPSTILKEEILPKLVSGKNFLASQNMEVVSNYGNPAKPVPLNAVALEKLKRGVFRVRQRPGKGNALGKIKFIFPNKDDVYLHDTPSKSLFKRTRRDFSHGCVRVETPEKLAEFVFKNQKNWNKDAIQKAMGSPTMKEVTLEKPIPVLLFYSTAFFNDKNELTFYPDIYDRDLPLLTALEKHEDLSDQAIFPPPKPQPAAPAATLATDNPPPPEVVDPRPAELMQE